MRCLTPKAYEVGSRNLLVVTVLDELVYVLGTAMCKPGVRSQKITEHVSHRLRRLEY